MIPTLIVHCVFEIENRGLNEVEIYRVWFRARSQSAQGEIPLWQGKTTPLADIDVLVLCGYQLSNLNHSNASGF